jgi:hypothetical protein
MSGLFGDASAGIPSGANEESLAGSLGRAHALADPPRSHVGHLRDPHTRPIQDIPDALRLQMTEKVVGRNLVAIGSADWLTSSDYLWVATSHAVCLRGACFRTAEQRFLFIKPTEAQQWAVVAPIRT